MPKLCADGVGCGILADELLTILHPSKLDDHGLLAGVMDANRMRHLYMKQLEGIESDIRTSTLAIAGMSCGACVQHVTRASDGMTGVVHVNVDLRTNEASIEHLPAFVDAASLIAAIRDAGYAVRVVATVDETDGTLVPEASAACGCGCCASESRSADGAWSNLGTGTIGCWRMLRC